MAGRRKSWQTFLLAGRELVGGDIVLIDGEQRLINSVLKGDTAVDLVTREGTWHVVKPGLNYRVTRYTADAGGQTEKETP